MKFTHNIRVVILMLLIIISLPIGISRLIVFIADQSIPPPPSQQTVPQTSE